MFAYRCVGVSLPAKLWLFVRCCVSRFSNTAPCPSQRVKADLHNNTRRALQEPCFGILTTGPPYQRLGTNMKGADISENAAKSSKLLPPAIEDGKVAVLESPTGTGKSLSLICGALTWLRDNARRQIEGVTHEEGEGDPNDWLAVSEREARKREYLRDLADAEQKLATIRKRELSRQKAQLQVRTSKKSRVEVGTTKSTGEDDEDFMLDDYEDGDGNNQIRNGTHLLSSSTMALLDKLKPAVREDDELEDHRTKIIFCSRTHSQLTQFVNELRRVTPPSGLPEAVGLSTLDPHEEVVKHLSLGSRKNLCINDKVSRLPSTLAINEKCLDLQKPGAAKEHKCQYLPGKEDKGRVDTFRDHAISTIRDIEDLGKLGREMKLCPYYASRAAIPTSEVLTLPYPLLLQKSAREALGVEIEGNVVVIDEAHNLMDAIAATLSTSLSLNQLETATKQVVAYVQRFKNKLKGLNRVYVTQVIRLLNSFTECLRQALVSSKPNDYAIVAADLMAGKGVDQIKPHTLLQYLVHSKLSHKVEGYTEAREQDASQTQARGVLMHFQNFLAVLMNPDSEGRFFVTKQDGDVLVRYSLLDPREHFRDIVEKARAVILAGGTMSPMSDYADYLFSYLDANRLSMFSFGHVIPKDNMFAEAVTRGPSGVEFDFTFEKRGSETMILELGRMLVKTSHTVPDGIVVFFPSYDYLTQVTKVWRRSSGNESIMVSLSAVKQVFEEVRGVPSEELLRDYSQAIDKGKGALMLSVVGGKLSEGINFSDKLGRAVIAVGLPFPNMYSAEWKAKIEHVEQTRYKRGKEVDGLSEGNSRSQAKAAGRDFYENACMRAVNQSIGRAIRHKNDYAAILLVDKRFATERIQTKLPKWIRGSMKGSATVNPWLSLVQGLESFFENKP